MTGAAVEYKQARHIARVQAAAREEGIKGAAYAVLSYLCSVSNFRKPITRASKEKIELRTGYCEKTIKAALATLRDAGFIEPVAFAKGGRGLCPVYVLRTKKGEENLPPLDAQDLTKGGKKLPEKGGKNFPKRGEKTSPPSEYLSGSLSGSREGGAFRAGRAGGTLDASASACPRPGSPEAEELRRFSREVDLHGYAEARRLQADRQRTGQADRQRTGQAGDLP